MKMEVLFTILLLICTLFVLCVDSENAVLSKSKTSGKQLSQICTPVGLNRNRLLRPRMIKRSTKRELVWIGAIVLYTPWMDFKGCGSLKENINLQDQKHNNNSELSLYECHQKCSNTSDYIGLQDHICYCLSATHLKKKFSCTHVKKCEEFLCYNRNKPTVVLYALNSTFPVNNSYIEQCGVFNFYDDVSFGSKRCSDTSHPVCYTNKTNFKTNKGHGNRSLSWRKSMRFCENTSPSSVTNLQSDNHHMIHGSYWTTSVRAARFIPVKDAPEDPPFHCVAAYISENNTIGEHVIEHCDNILPVLCLETTDSADLAKNTHYNSSTTPTNMINDNDKEEQVSRIPWEIIAGCFGLIGIIITIALVIVKYKNKSPTRTEISTEETGLNHSAPSNEEADHENVYNDSSSKERCAVIKDKDYDSMSVIRQETEEVYDHTSSANISPKSVEDVNIYDHADPVVIKQSLQTENDGVYNQCELNIKSVIANAKSNRDSTTIYDHA
ncbi:uncharacterized protein LOC127733749 [Mytilus californianus]|uniref:uncharacterized protein LOC127733749 n=1 Tax=Mytilus californianus TaxID=6549 RepID=UPI0022457A35|nr:uncharacterized protein LOC127733749 [Mytilus californianus]